MTYVRTFVGWVYCAFIIDVFVAASSAGRFRPRCAPTSPSTPWRWACGPAGATGTPPAPWSPLRRRRAIPRRPLHRTAGRGRRRRLGGQQGRLLRQRPGRGVQQPVQGRAGAQQGPVDGASTTWRSQSPSTSTGSTTAACTARSASSRLRARDQHNIATSAASCSVGSMLHRYPATTAAEPGVADPRPGRGFGPADQAAVVMVLSSRGRPGCLGVSGARQTVASVCRRWSGSSLRRGRQRWPTQC